MDPNVTPAYPNQNYVNQGHQGQSGWGQPAAVSVGDWFITILVSAIPLVGFIMLFVWAFGSNTPPSKANWAKATLLFGVIFLGLGVVFFSSIMALMRH